MKRVSIFGSILAISVAMNVSASAQFSAALDTAKRTADDAKKSQQVVDQRADQTAELLNQFKADQRQLDASLRYNNSLERTIEGQEREIGRLTDDIANVAGLQQAVEPLMIDMVAAFEKFVDADIPFNLDGPNGRLARVNRVRQDIDNPNTSAAQKYRSIVEAYSLENEFGRTVNHYTGTIDVDGTETSGEFLQVGRVELIFKTENDQVLKAWDNDTKAWSDLPLSYVPDVKIAMRMAKGQMAPNLFALPIRRASSAQ